MNTVAISRVHGDHHPVVPEAILPEQFAALWGQRVAQPEEALLYALLEQAMRDLRSDRRSARLRGARRLYLDAYRWVSSLDRSYPFSFLNVCEMLRLSPQAVRARLLSREVQAVAPMEAAR
jgi:hypothetical protein